MKLEDEDLRKLARSSNYRFLIDEANKRFGIETTVRAILFPDSLDRFLYEKSDKEGVYWLPKQGNERILVEILEMTITNEKKILFKLAKE